MSGRTPEFAGAAHELRTLFLLNDRRYPALDGLRGLATIMIFNVHFFAQYAEKNYFVPADSLVYQVLRAIHSGSLGVDILFILSGFLTYLSFHNRSTNVLEFISRRFQRLLPVILIVNLPALCWGAREVSWQQLVDNVFFLKLFPETSFVTYITWALTYEMWFYVFFALAFILTSRWAFSRQWGYQALLWVALVVNILVLQRLGLFCDARFVGFMLGIAMARMLAGLGPSALPERFVRPAAVVSLGVIPVMCWMWSNQTVQHAMSISTPWRLAFHLSYAVATSLLLWGLLRPGGVTSLLASTPMRLVGVVSYSFFMIHIQWGLPIANSLIVKPSSLAGIVVAWWLAFGVSLALAISVFFFLERPYFRK